MERRELLAACSAGAVGMAAIGAGSLFAQPNNTTKDNRETDGQSRLSVDQAAVLLVDHQAGLLSLVGSGSI